MGSISLRQKPSSPETHFARNPVRQKPTSPETHFDRNPVRQKPSSTETHFDRNPVRQKPTSTETHFDITQKVVCDVHPFLPSLPYISTYTRYVVHTFALSVLTYPFPFNSRPSLGSRMSNVIKLLRLTPWRKVGSAISISVAILIRCSESNLECLEMSHLNCLH